MNILTGLIARILFAIPFLAFGVRHFLHANQASFPGGVIGAYIVGLVFILASISAITKYQGTLLMLVLAVVLIILAFAVALPAMTSTDAAAKAAGMVGFYADLGLAGGALILAGAFATEKKVV